LDDQRRIPTVVMFDGQEVPLTYAPAGVKRAAKLAYLLAWAFSEHEQEAERIGQPMSPQVIVLLDEPETHLHPRWQRTILPSLWRAGEGWHGTHKPQAQFLVATHSPLVLASMEPLFDPKQDTLWKLDLVEGRVRVERDHWRLRGDVNRWLLSDVFDLSEATSSEAEEALGRAKELLRQDKPERAEVLGVSEELGRLLPEMDPFWVRWRYYMRSHLEEGGEA
jgi:hypothetical protein